MDIISKWWNRHIGAGNINRTLEDAHSKYGKIEYLLPALYLLYCLVLMQLIVKSFGAVEAAKHGLAMVIKLLLVHMGLTLAVFLAVSRFPGSPAAKLLEHFLKNQLPSGSLAFAIPLGCMLLAFIWGMFKKLLSKK